MLQDDKTPAMGKEENSHLSQSRSGSSRSKQRFARMSGINPLAKWGLITLVSIFVIIGCIWFFLSRNDYSTDDSFIDGRTIIIAPRVAGYVSDLLVNDNQFVRKGQILLKIDPSDYNARVTEAEADVEQAEAILSESRYQYQVAQASFPAQLQAAKGELAAAKAGLFKAETDYRRQHALSRAATTQQQIDYSRAALETAKAGLKQAEANLAIAEPVKANIEKAKANINQQEATLKQTQARLEQARLNLQWTVIEAPSDGWISKRNVERGTYVMPGQSLLAVVEPGVWVTANFKESQITRMRTGDKVDIKVDAYPSLRLKGHVDSIQYGTGSAFSVFPPENATGNFVKVVQRVPVKILIDEGLDPKIFLSIGLSVVPIVHVSG